MFRIADLDFIEYYQIGSNAGINKLISAVNRVLDEIKKREEIEKEKKHKAEIEKKKEKIKTEINILENDLYNQVLQENLLLAQIAEKKISLKNIGLPAPYVMQQMTIVINSATLVDGHSTKSKSY